MLTEELAWILWLTIIIMWPGINQYSSLTWSWSFLCISDDLWFVNLKMIQLVIAERAYVRSHTAVCAVFCALFCMSVYVFQRSEIKQLDGEIFREHYEYPGHKKTNIIITNRYSNNRKMWKMWHFPNFLLSTCCLYWFLYHPGEWCVWRRSIWLDISIKNGNVSLRISKGLQVQREEIWRYITGYINATFSISRYGIM